MKLISTLFIITILSLLCLGGMIGSENYKNEEDYDNYIIRYDNITNNGIDSFYNRTISNYDTYEEGYNDYNLGYMITETLYYGMKMSFRVARVGIKIGYQNPQYNFIMFLWMLNLFLILSVLLMCLPALPLIIAIGYLLYIGIKKLIKFIISYFKHLFLFDDDE